MENLEERLDNIERQYATALAEKDLKTAALEKELNDMKANQGKAARDASVTAAVKKHNIPEWRMKGVVVPDDQDPDAYLAAIKQDLITQSLMSANTEGSKVANEQETSEAADYLLSKISVPVGAPTLATANSAKKANF